MILIAVFIVGFVGAIIGYVTGLASVFTYPALLLLGFPPVVANTTNVISNVGGSAGSVLAGWRQIRSINEYPRLAQYLISAAGGLVGGYLLLVADPQIFEYAVPWLVLIGVLAVGFTPLLLRSGRHIRLPVACVLIMVFFVGIYSGYFGAASAVMYLAIASLFTSMTTHEALLMKAPVIGVANLVAAIYYFLGGAVDVLAALTMLVGGLVGGTLGPSLAGRFSDRMIRMFVLVFGLALFAWLLWRTI